MKKVLIITYYWPPSGGAGVQRWLKFTKYLTYFDISPIVITVNPDKASYPLIDKTLLQDVGRHVRVITTDTFEPYGVYKKVTKSHELPYSGFANESKPGWLQQAMRFIRGNFFIPDARQGWNRHAIGAAKKVLDSTRIHTIITTSPPHSTQLIGLRLKEEYGLPWLADLRDPWTDIYYYRQMNHTRWAASKDAQLERKVLEQADHVVVVSESIKRLFASKLLSRQPDKIEVIPNGFDEADYKGLRSKQPADFVVTYTGTLSDLYDPKGFITAFNELSKTSLKLKLRLVGKVSEDVRSRLNPKNVEVIGHVEHARSLKYLMETTVLLLVIPNVKDNEGILTGKLFEYLASKKHIICLGPKNGDAAKIIADCDAGKVFGYEDAHGIRQHLSHLMKLSIDGMSIGGHNDRYLQFSRKSLTQQLVKVLNL